MDEPIRIISLSERSAWEAEVADGLPCHSWAYANALSASGVAPQLAVIRADGARMVMPFFERDWGTSTDIATIIGPSGASIVPSSYSPLSRWREFAATRGWVAGYIQLALSAELDAAFGDDDLVTSNEVFILDLDDYAIARSVSRSIRRKLDSAARSGAVLVDDRSELSASLKSLYPATMQRLGAPPRYHFCPETLECWALDEASLVLGARVGGAIEAVYLFRFAGSYAESHILGTTEGGRTMISWLLHTGIECLRQKGITKLNLGGGVRPGDGLYRFKERFGGTPKPLRAVLQIYDKAKYLELCRNSGVAPSGGWFPAYRIADLRSDDPAARI